MKALIYNGLVIGCDHELEIVGPNVVGPEQSFSGLDVSQILIVECDDATVAGFFYDPVSGEFSPPTPPVSNAPPTVGAIAFQRLFTRAERVKARELCANDPDLDDIWKQLEDQRADVVVMALPSVQEDIEYTLNAVKAAGLEIDVAARKAEILSGQIR